MGKLGKVRDSEIEAVRRNDGSSIFSQFCPFFGVFDIFGSKPVENLPKFPSAIWNLPKIQLPSLKSGNRRKGSVTIGVS